MNRKWLGALIPKWYYLSFVLVVYWKQFESVVPVILQDGLLRISLRGK
jgi:hypothetical protein